MPMITNLIGNKYGNLMVVQKSNKKNKNRETSWICICDCGNTTTVIGSNLKNGNTKSCGCLHKKHGMARSRIYKIWINMKSRCYNINTKSYKDYGRKGIRVCSEWKNDFKNFYDWAIVNGYKDNLTIDRINVNENYKPSNCRWVNKKEQANNTTRNHYIELNGEKHTLQQWSEKTKIKSSTIRERLKRGWTIEKALSK